MDGHRRELPEEGGRWKDVSCIEAGLERTLRVVD